MAGGARRRRRMRRRRMRRRRKGGSKFSAEQNLSWGLHLQLLTSVDYFGADLKGWKLTPLSKLSFRIYRNISGLFYSKL